MQPLKEGDKVVTSKGERATIYVLHPTEPFAVVAMTDQFMPGGGQAFRTVPLTELTKAVS